MTAPVLVVDVGTSGVRAAAVRDDATVTAVHHRVVLPASPAPGLVEFDAAELARAALDVAQATLAEVGSVSAIGIANQRASSIVWDRATGEPVAPGLGWQDLRTVGDCLVLAADGVRLAPNLSATKFAAIWDAVDRARTRDLCVGTVDSWLVWTLTAGDLHVTDHTNAALTGLLDTHARVWDTALLERLRIPHDSLPRLVDSIGVVGSARALPGAPPIAGIAGDQQASLVGQRCTRPGLAKATFGTGGMLDLCVGPQRPAFATRGTHGTFPIVAWTHEGEAIWGVEAVMLAAGSNIEWLRDDLGIISSSAESHEVAARCADTGGVTYVPALLGLGTPSWDYGARGTLVGITRGTGRAEIVRAVLEGVAQRGADLVDAAEAETGLRIDSLRVDGGMTANPTFVAALAKAIGRPIEISPELEATTLGAGLLAGVAIGIWRDLDELATTWSPRAIVEPDGSFDRDHWADACRRAARWFPDLSDLDF